VTASRFAVVLLAGGLFGLGASDAHPVSSDGTTISMLALVTTQPAYNVLIPNFERVNPNIKVNVTYAPNTTTLNEIEATELAAGNAPDILTAAPGCGNAVAVCKLAGFGELAPMVAVPWAKRSLAAVISRDKYGEGLFAFTPGVSFGGVFTNDGLFAKLGLKVPQTFAQLLAVCQKAKADGTAAVILNGGNPTSLSILVYDLVTATVYAQDRNWTGELKAGKVTFDGTAGWRTALQEVTEMDDAGCFEPGVAGTTNGEALFAQGEGLMTSDVSGLKGTIDAGNPQFGYTFRPFPGGSAANETSTFLNIATTSLGVNAHSSAASQAAAQTFIDFIARPKQDALYAELTGGVTQSEILRDQLPSFMSPDFGPVVKSAQYVLQPSVTWWNPNVLLALQSSQVGLLTGQSTVDEILNAMDAAWKQGPS
jgi:raffinose/stachyose/melibiose transport system substrate-binding protein